MLLLVYAADGKQVLLADALVDGRVDHSAMRGIGEEQVPPRLGAATRIRARTGIGAEGLR
jgi:hypothetical protein